MELRGKGFVKKVGFKPGVKERERERGREGVMHEQSGETEEVIVEVVRPM